jgi:hypothetical protein
MLRPHSLVEYTTIQMPHTMYVHDSEVSRLIIEFLFLATCNEESGGTARRHATWAAGQPIHTTQPKADDRALR